MKPKVSNAARSPRLEPLSAVQSATPSAVDTVIADGRMLKQGGRVIGVDTPALAQQGGRGWQHCSVAEALCFKPAG
jgi:hypothetical protein